MPLALLIEDHATNRKLLRDILEVRLEVVVAETAEQALRLLQECNPDLILLDLHLPGVDGHTFLRQLKQLPATASIPVVAISACAMPEDIERAMTGGCAEYVTKPLVEDPLAFADRMARLATQGAARLS